jgi:hypothetical protein
LSGKVGQKANGYPELGGFFLAERLPGEDHRGMRFASALFAWLWAAPVSAMLIGYDDFSVPDGPVAGRNSGALWNYLSGPRIYSATAAPWRLIAGAPSVRSGRLVLNPGDGAFRTFNGHSLGRPGLSDERAGAIQAAGEFWFRFTLRRAGAEGSAGLILRDFHVDKVLFGIPAQPGGGPPRFGIEVKPQPPREANGPKPEEIGVFLGAQAWQPGRDHRLLGQVDFTRARLRLWVDSPEGRPGPPTVERPWASRNFVTAIGFSSADAITEIDDLAVATLREDLD